MKKISEMFTKLPIIRIRFYKSDDKWYADVPDSPEEENLMVSDAHTILEQIGRGKLELDLYVSESNPKEFKDMCVASFHRIHHDNNGGTYNAYSNGLGFSHGFENVWLCNVTHKVFGEHPKDIYIYKFR